MRKNQYIDTHAHLTASSIEEPELLVERAMLEGVETMINICTDEASLEKGVTLARRYSSVYNTAATTPHDVERDGESFFPYVEEAVKQGDLIAIGESGLDYYYEHSDREIQKKFLKKYLSLGVRSGLPLIFHCRDAFADLFAIADEYYLRKGVLHCFTGTLDEAKGVLNRGWYLSLSGIVTFKRSEELRAVAKYVPLDRLFLETDTPYLAPQSKRGKQNEPSFLPEIAEVVAREKGISLEELAKVTRENARSFFGIEG